MNNVGIGFELKIKMSDCIKAGAGLYIGWKIVEGFDKALGKKYGPKIKKACEKIKKESEKNKEED